MKMNRIDTTNVLEYLADRGIAHRRPSLDARYTEHFGLNYVLQVDIKNGGSFLVKQTRPTVTETPARDHESQTTGYQNPVWEGQLYSFVQQCEPLLAISTIMPDLVFYDEEDQILVTKLIPGHSELMRHYRHYKRFSLAIASNIGEQLSLIHSISHANTVACSPLIAMDYGTRLNLFGIGVSPDNFLNLPPEATEFLSILHRDQAVFDSIVDLQENRQKICLTHNDPRSVNILRPNDCHSQSKSQQLKLIDWEFWGWGDPGCDVGTIIGDYLTFWLSSVPIKAHEDASQWFAHATIPFSRVQPAIQRFWRSYNSTDFASKLPLKHFNIQVIRYAGSFLVSQAMVLLMMQQRLSTTSVCMLQIARNLLVEPENYVATLLGR